MTIDLSGKTAVITGASRGIGAATAAALANAGVSRFLLQYNSHKAGIDELTQKLTSGGASVESAQANLSTMEGIESFAGEVKRREWPIDILVNNAGSLVKRAKLPESSSQHYDDVLNLNCKSVWLITQAVLPFMLGRDGSIVNLSSIAARNGGGPGAVLYAAAKAMVSTMTKGLAKELAPQGIRVNAVSPGTVDNHFHEVFSTQQMLDAMLASVPCGRLGTNEEVADLIVYLCSPGARYVHGQTIEVNGGMFMI